MTVPISCPPPSVSSATEVPPRKRRRRAPATGASDDCFACTKRNLKCDRRRPYCSQCLEYGKECSGYKTQLTWGVGVASRGKLRGLSLPVAKSAPVAKCPTLSRARAGTSTTAPRQIYGNSRPRSKDEDRVVDVKVEPAPLQMSPTSYTTYDFINMAPSPTTSMVPPSPVEQDWNMQMSQEYLHPEQMTVPSQVSHQSFLRQSLHHLQTPSILQTEDMGLSTSADTISTYSGSDYASPTEYSYSSRDFGREEPIPFFSGSSMRMYNMFPCQTPPIDHGRGTMSYTRGPTSYPDQYYAPSEMSSSISSAQNMYDIPEQTTHSTSPVDACTLSDIFYDDEILGAQSGREMGYDNHAHSKNISWNTSAEDENSRPMNEAIPYHRIENVSSLLTSSVPPRMAFLLDYYEKIICPTLVVIDSPKNPFKNILSLAIESESLQHAICVFAACNLRMKRKESLGQDRWRSPHQADFHEVIIGNRLMNEDVSTPTTRADSPEDNSIQEEAHHQTLAVQLLNQNLSDPNSARHDSVLATLLILCHFRMCESGIAQFKTQFAGVKKLMGMRGNGLETGRWGWMETLFTYLDAITATVNDREAQLRGGFFEMIASPSQPSWTLENLAGCDGRLFKIIARLGRLNLLSQHRPVLDPLDPPAPRGTIPQPKPHRLSGQVLVEFYNLNSEQHNNFNISNESAILDDHLDPTGNEDSRPLFWQEWREIRSQLQNWDFDANRLVANLPVTPTPIQLRDFSYISEAFRYAALLYTERLANPRASAGASNIQNLVSQVLYYLTRLSSAEGAQNKKDGSGMGRGVEGFLLWPLFVAGSESVSHSQRQIVRSNLRSCRSGYHSSGQDLLERMWRDMDQGVERCGGVVGGMSGVGAGSVGGFNNEALGKGWDKPFRWTGYMDDGKGEYIMV